MLTLECLIDVAGLPSWGHVHLPLDRDLWLGSSVWGSIHCESAARPDVDPPAEWNDDEDAVLLDPDTRPCRVGLYSDPALVLRRDAATSDTPRARPASTGEVQQPRRLAAIESLDARPASPSASISRAVAPHVDPVDFSDLESQRVLAVAARAVARELGRQAAREYFAELISTKAPT